MTRHSIVQPYLTELHTPYRLSKQPSLPLGKAGPSPLSIVVDPRVCYQEIEGFGGALTEAAALTFYKLPADQQVALLRAYFDLLPLRARV